MKTFRLRNGDLALSGGKVAMVQGTTKVVQDLRGALLEPLGTDRFHPGWGSTLGTDVGNPTSTTAEFEVTAEVNRVISNHAAVQRDRIEADLNSGATASRFTTDEVLQRLVGVETTLRADTARVKIQLQTVSGEMVVMNEDLY